MIIAKYTDIIKKGNINKDIHQKLIVKKLDVLAKKITAKRGVLSRLFCAEKPPKGLYIYGDVGRGKSMLMDLFFDNICFTSKRRVHFHAFMLEIHDRIYELKKQDKNIDAIEHIADDIAQESKILCFDEFQVTDIADAMILGRLFNKLFSLKVIVIATSNRHPDELYKNGLQRENFLPFIEIFKSNMNVASLDGEIDYRLQHIKSLATTYFTPLGKKADDFAQNSFAELTNNAKAKTREIRIKGRILEIKKCAKDVAFFDFQELCEQALGAIDYIEIAREFASIIIVNIPQIGKENRNQAKRFVTLIDELYEHKIKLICTAEVDIDCIYSKGDGSFEFERTASRLFEMQSNEYLKQAHIS